jgi:intracellular sulfur oxidation DsrE/DsrF family protein
MHVIVKQMIKRIIQIVILLLLPLSMIKTVVAEHGTPNKLVIQVSTDDVRTQKVALNNAVNLQKLYGLDNVVIEIVAYGPGLNLLTKNSVAASRVESLALQNITFSACENTMKTQHKRTGKKPVLLEGVETVNAGVARIIELQQQGYAYIRP